MNAKITLAIAASLLASASAFAGPLIITTEDAPPFNYTTDGGKTISGFATETVNEMFKRANVPYKTTLYPWVRAIEMAKTEKDTCVYSTTRTEEREKSFAWVGPLAPNNWVMFAKADSNITLSSLEDARKYKVGGYKGDAISLFLQAEKFKVDEAINDEQNIQKLDAGRIELWAAGALGGPFQAKKMNIKVKPLLTFKKAEFYLACNLAVDPAVIKKLNATLQDMVKDGTFDKINKK